MSNPYTPNAGARPPALIGRDEQIEDFRVLLARLSKGRSERSMIITGLRGVGKTVLLGRFRGIAIDHGWTVVEWEVSKHDETAPGADGAILRLAGGDNTRVYYPECKPKEGRGG